MLLTRLGRAEGGGVTCGECQDFCAAFQAVGVNSAPRLIGHPPQPGQDVFEILAQIDVQSPTRFHDRRDGRTFGPACSLPICSQFFRPSVSGRIAAAQPIWSAKKLGTLLEHVELANYNRELVNWKLADDVDRQFVVSPQIDPALDGDMNWRRPLWESFYPRIRKESSLEAAAEIAVRHLRERVRIVEPPGSAETIVEIWQRGSASERGFEVIYTAALRSAGVPARLSPQSKTEFWNGVEWKPAPRPMDVAAGSK